MTNSNTLRLLRGPGRISVAYGNSPAPGLGKVEALVQCDVPSSWFARCFVNLGTDCYGSQCSWPGPLQAAIVSRVLCLFACSFVCLFVLLCVCLCACLLACVFAVRFF